MTTVTIVEVMDRMKNDILDSPEPLEWKIRVEKKLCKVLLEELSALSPDDE